MSSESARILPFSDTKVGPRIALRIPRRITNRWRAFWLARTANEPFGRVATRLAAWGTPPYKGRVPLAWIHPNGYIAPSAEVSRKDLRLAGHVFIGERVIVYRQGSGALIEFGEGVEIHNDCIFESIEGGSISVGDRTTIQARCNFASAADAPIQIGRRVQIAQLCGFYSYDHAFSPDKPIYEQPLESRGPIVLEDDVWLGYNVVVLSGVRIGQGAVIGAGSVVTRDVPAGGIAPGVPAKVLKMR
ncbi:MAG TPA: acyltransferase [Chthoniobacterales bacterium]